jgi:hypothetical protein
MGEFGTVRRWRWRRQPGASNGHIEGGIGDAFQAPALLDTTKGQLSCFCWLDCEDEWQSTPSPPK